MNKTQRFSWWNDQKVHKEPTPGESIPGGFCFIGYVFNSADLTVKPLHPGTDWDLLPTDWDQALVLSASTTATRSWLDSLPPPSSLCSASRPRQRDSCSACRSRPTWPLSSATSSGSLARITFKMTVPTYKAVNGTAPTHLRALVRPHAPLEPSARLPRPAGTAIPESEQRSHS